MGAALSDLEKDIEASRARLDQTIDRIQNRLSTGSLVDEMLGSARRTPLNGLYDTALESVRRNPLPVLLIATGLSMLFGGIAKRAGRSGRPAPLRSDRAPVLRTGADRTYDPDHPTGHPAREPVDDARI